MARRLVVDASIARSAGLTENPESLRSREFLAAVRESSHKVVFSAEIALEWRKHRSRYAATWLAAMTSSGRVVRVSTDGSLRDAINEALASCQGLTENQKRAVEKDVLLADAACASDKLVASRDDKVRAMFAVLSKDVSQIRAIAWVNPTRPEEIAVSWIKSGARSDDWRMLKNYEP